MQNLTQHPDVTRITDKISEKAAKGHYLVSDIILRENGREYQFVDLVMEGGGTLGIALVGYIHALEQAGVRFLGMGGSSVGAIVALLAYSCGERTMAKGEKLAEIVGDMDLGGMLDGSYPARKLSNLVVKETARLRAARIFFNAVACIKGAVKKIGLHPGDQLYDWIAEKLAGNGIHNLAGLNKLTESLPEGLINRETGEKIVAYDTKLKIVAADITTSTKAVFPEMAAMYWQVPEEVNPACFARASASIPLFFQPFTVSGISSLIENSDKWARLGSFTGTIPDKITFADGGILSNFPIDLFKRFGVPRAPTLGARLGDKNRSAKDVDKFGQYANQLFNSLQHCADYDFIFKNPLYKYLIAHIPTNKYSRLDFNMGPEDKLGLFKEGVAAGYKFLEEFNWPQYKELRAAELDIQRVHARYVEKNKKQD